MSANLYCYILYLYFFNLYFIYSDKQTTMRYSAVMASFSWLQCITVVLLIHDMYTVRAALNPSG